MNDTTPTVDRRPTGSDAANIRTEEETLVADSRASLSPSQLVEQRLLGMLKDSSVMVSHVQRRLKPGPR